MYTDTMHDDIDESGIDPEWDGAEIYPHPVRPQVTTPAPSQRRRDLTLQRAGELINGDRDQSYGDASESFARIGKIWSAILGVNLTSAQVASCLAGLKLARLAASPDHEDSWVDLAGYAALGSEVAEK